MSSKCSYCGYYKTACQCRKDDNYCGHCHRVISDCSCRCHNDHWRYDNPKLDTFDNDNPCNGPVVDGRYGDYGGNDGGNESGGNDDGGNDSGGNDDGGNDSGGNDDD